MSRSALTGGYLTRPGAAWAMLFAGCLAAASAAGQTNGATVTAEMADQKGRMLEVFFSSDRLREALDSNPDAVGPLEAEARAKWTEGKAALADRRNADAVELFDAGMRAVSRAIALATLETEWDAKAASIAFVARRRHAEAYLAAIERSENISESESTDAIALRVGLDEADRQFANGNLRSASKTLDRVYREIVSFVSEIRGGRTVVVSRVFKTPKEEYEYELRRNESYELLIQITLAERGDDQPGFAELAARLTTEGERIREQGERQAATGNFPLAISTMERATERLLVVLRASGLVMIE